jgi:hypothetical protein
MHHISIRQKHELAGTRPHSIILNKIIGEQQKLHLS